MASCECCWTAKMEAFVRLPVLRFKLFPGEPVFSIHLSSLPPLSNSQYHIPTKFLPGMPDSEQR